MNILWISFVLSIFTSLTTSHPTTPKRNKLLYILLDGFRYDYVDMQPEEFLPGFSRLLNNGVRAQYMSPIYPSLSYPAWTTLVTGLWAESHGIVGNFIYDAEDKKQFPPRDDDEILKKKWWTAEPIWTTAAKANLRAAVILQSQCDVPFDGVVPEYCEIYIPLYDPQVFRTRMEEALQRLEDGFDFVMLYNEHVDHIGHIYGPESLEMRKAIRDIDSTVVYMLNRLEETGMADQVNVIITSDHGMAPVGPRDAHKVELDDYLLTEYVETIGDAGAFSNIKVKEGHVKEVYDKLKTMPGVEVFKHNEIPDRFHYKRNSYIHDIILKADYDTFIMMSFSSKMVPLRNTTHELLGTHGFDNNGEKVRTIFFAIGPDFKSGHEIPPIEQVDVHPMLAYLLKVKPLPNNGTFENVESALEKNTTMILFPLLSLIFLFVILLLLSQSYIKGTTSDIDHGSYPSACHRTGFGLGNLTCFKNIVCRRYHSLE